MTGAAQQAATTTTRGTLLVVDGHSLAFRAFFALPAENFSTKDGRATNAVWGFATMLSQVLDSEKPDHLAVAFDMKGGTFRNQMLPQYKGTREAAPQELLDQLPVIQKMLADLGVTYIEKQGFEGDDIIATLATMGEQAGYDTLVLSGDRDAFQLITDRVTVLYPGHHFKDLKHMTPQAVEEKYHVSPSQYPDLAALRGETADNIPGVPGVGDGFAAKWINQFGGLESIIEHADEIKGKKGEALRESIDQVRLNRKVNALLRDVDLGVDVDDLTFGGAGIDVDAIDKLFTDLEFGVRTKSKVLKSFNGGARPAASRAAGADAAGKEDDDRALTLPALADDVHDAARLAAWLDALMPARSGKPSADTATASDTSADAEDTVLADRVRAAAVLDVTGCAKPGRARCDSIALSAEGHAAMFAVPTADDGAEDSGVKDNDAAHHGLQTILDRYAGRIIVHGYKEQLHMLAAAGLTLPEPLFDTKLAGYLIDPDFHAESVEQAAEHFLDIRQDDDEEPSQGQLDFDVDDDGADAAASQDAGKTDESRELTQLAMIRALADHLAPALDGNHQSKLLRSIELPVSRVLGGMERAGASVDMMRLTAMRDQFATDAREAQETAWRYAGSRINLQSPKQLQKVLFEDMGLKPTKKTKSGSYTTNASALQDLALRTVDDERANGFLTALLRHRETNKLKQIVQTLIDAVNPQDGRIHTTFEQTVAATGRLSSVDPNLQNIPNRNAEGREIRSAFVPGDGYESLLSCDYSQVELRIMADLSGDEALIEAFRSGADFHKYVASLVYGVPVEEITPDQRTHVKAMSYGLAYGLSTYGLAQQLKIRPGEAEKLKSQYFATFGKVHDYLESLVADARRDGYTETMFGRRRYFPGLKSTNRNIRDAAERGALNAPIQGSAADIMKIAMVRAGDALAKAGLASRIILQIHDELVVEVAHGEAEQVTQLVRDAMEHAVDLAVPLDVSTGLGSDWQLAAH
ncbi:DNA polymerase I [Bifidobacterium leontopitheci]|uniref:DNA polymerase I n=1 Tax=Bifidobacterium leontopitheci TaxID=2650774 RepID=A0A6I1GEK3_9BIFI|nr:DNA polymerase I [Bifidobacterium leontopitheci]KAB7790064.1 DNA-directed DNA polymerase [Bifidobacterium leontopitheci]